MFKSKSPQKTRLHLLQTAKKLFAKRGFHAVTVRDIAQAAKTNVASIHYHFGDMYGLYTAILHTHLDEVRENAEKEKLHLKTPTEYLLGVCLHMQKMLRKKKDFSRIVHHALMCDGDPKLKKITREILDLYMRPLVERLRYTSQNCRWKNSKAKIPVDGFVFVIVSMMHYWSLFASELHVLFDRPASQLKKDVSLTLNNLILNYAQQK